MISRSRTAEPVRRRRWLLVDDNEDILALMEATMNQLFGVESA